MGKLIMRAYAEATRVPVEKTKVELERLLRKHGAEGFAAGWDAHEDRIEFLWKGKQIRFTLTRQSAHSPTRREQLERQRWRALLLVVKAKLEAVRAGIAVFEQEFLGFIVVSSSGRTIYEHAAPRLQAGDFNAAGLLPEAGSGGTP